MAFAKQERQKIIDGYLAETGKNMFVASEFVDWLEVRPDHPAYPSFFSATDQHAARQYRIQMARQMVSGLRISVRTESGEGETYSVKVQEFPAYISPMAGRRFGGGHVSMDPTDASHIAELRNDGVRALKAWLNRYGGAFDEEAIGIHRIIEAHEAGKPGIRKAD